MKIKITLFLFLICTSFFAQSPPIEWAKCYGGTSGENAYSVIQTKDTGYIVVGQASSNNGTVIGQKGMGDIWLTKLNIYGSLQWQKCYGGTLEEFGSKVLQLTDGGYIMVGCTKSNNIDISGNHGSWDGVVVRTDINGNLLWQKCYGGTLNDYLYSIAITPDGGYLLYGYTFSNDGDVIGNHGGSDLWIIKVNSLGLIQWQKCYGGPGGEGTNLGSPLVNHNSGYVMVGNSSSSTGDLTNNKGITDVWVVNIDTIGNIIWQNNFGGTGTDFGRAVQFDKDSNIIVLADINSIDIDVTNNYGQQDAWLLKISKSGNLIGQKNYGGAGYDGAYTLINSQNDGFIFVGVSDSYNFDALGNHGGRDVWIVKLDSNLNKQWHHCYGGIGTEQAYSIINTKDNGYAFCGYATTNDGDVSGCTTSGPGDLWVVKLVGSVGIEELINKNKVICFPNPTNNYLSIKLENSEVRNYEIFDVSGRIISKGILTNETISVENFHSGIYLINFETESGNYFAKFIKE